MPLVAIITLEASPLAISALLVVEFAPFLLISLPAGVWVDRLPRRPILIIGDFGRAAIPIAYVLDALTIWQLYVVGFFFGVFTVFFDVAYQSYLPSLVAREQLVEGNSKLEISRSSAQLGGPAVAGVLVETIKAPFTILADAISFVASGLFVLRISNEISARIGVGPAIVVGAMCGISQLLVPLAPQDAHGTIPYLIVSGLIGGFGVVLYNVTQVSMRQAITPERLQGRMNSVIRFIVWGVMPIGQLTGGALATVFSLRTAIWVGAIGCALAWLPVMFGPVRSLKEVPEVGQDEPRPGDVDPVPLVPGPVPVPEEP